MVKKSFVVLSLVAALLLPGVSRAVMSGPNANVSADWKPGNSGSANANTSNVQLAQVSTGNAINSLATTETLKASVDVSFTITGVDRSANMIAINGKWVDMNRVANYVTAHWPNMGPATTYLPLSLSILRSGDQIRIKASLADNMLRVETVDFDRAGSSAQEVMMRDLLKQVGRMLSGLTVRMP